jgi:hypothetical protein
MLVTSLLGLTKLFSLPLLLLVVLFFNPALPALICENKLGGAVETVDEDDVTDGAFNPALPPRICSNSDVLGILDVDCGTRSGVSNWDSADDANASAICSFFSSAFLSLSALTDPYGALGFFKGFSGATVTSGDG